MDTYVSPALYPVDLAECRELAKLRPEEVIATFGAALRRAGATIVHGLTHAFPGAGLTCVFIPSESRPVLHTCPEPAILASRGDARAAANRDDRGVQNSTAGGGQAA